MCTGTDQECPHAACQAEAKNGNQFQLLWHQHSLLETPDNLKNSVFTLILSENEQSRMRHVYKTHLQDGVFCLSQ